MRRKIIAILIAVLIMTFAPAEAFAGKISTSLEAGFSDGHFGNYHTMQAGTSETIQFYMGEDDGKNFVIQKKIPAKEKDFEVYDEDWKETDLVKLKALSNGKMVITPSSDINSSTEFQIVYVGSKYKLNSSNTFSLYVTANKEAIAQIKGSKISGIALKSSKAGISVSFKTKKNIEGYEIYRSTNKKTGFKKVADISKITFLDQSSLKKGTRYYYKVRGYVNGNGKKIYTKYSDIYSAKAVKNFSKVTADSLTKAHLNAHDKSLLKEAYIFGVSNDIKFKYGATGFNDMLNNLQYAFLIGDYDLGFAYPSKAKASAARDTIFKILSEKGYDGVYADLFCAFNNCILESTIEYENGQYCVYISAKNAKLSNEEIFSNQKKAVARVKEIAKEMREKGKIKEDMTQKEIAQVYYEYVSNAKVGHLEFSGNELESGICMTEDTPYAFLFDRMASCLGHTATYNQFLHYEGIQAYGASNWFGQVEGENGHIISYIICDGQEYFTDTTNQLPLMDQKSIEKHLIFRNGSLQRVRKTAGMI